MSEDKSVVIRGVTIKVGDLVKIKFRKLEDVLQDRRAYCRATEIVQHYDIGNHLETFVQGTGHFKVDYIVGENGHLRLSDRNNRRSKSNMSSVLANLLTPKQPGASSTAEAEENLPEISILDQANGNSWILNDILIEEIIVENDVADYYFSEQHQLSLALIDSVLFVNGHPLTTADSKIYEMFEKVLADAAIKKCLEVNLNEDDDRLNF